MAKIRRFEELRAWQNARDLTREVYVISGQGVFAKDFSLRDQIRSAAGSTMHNIAEGFASGSDPEFIRFLRYSRRSATEVQSQLYIAIDQEYIEQDTFNRIYEQADNCKRSINGLIGYLTTSNKRAS